MRVAFVTTNQHKFREVKDILKTYPVELEHINLEYEENQDASLKEIARTAAHKLARELKRPVIVEDTGFFFTAYPGFPGALTKFVFNSLGYKGILKLLAGESPVAYSQTVAGFCRPGAAPVTFIGKLNGTITDHVYDEDKDTMPYNRIFIPAGYDVTVSKLSLAQWNSISQRAQAFRKFGEYIMTAAESA